MKVIDSQKYNQDMSLDGRRWNKKSDNQKLKDGYKQYIDKKIT